MTKNNKEKTNYTAKESRELTEALKLTDEVCATCGRAFRKNKGTKYKCLKNMKTKEAFDTCEDYEKNSFLEGME